MKPKITYNLILVVKKTKSN